MGRMQTTTTRKLRWAAPFVAGAAVAAAAILPGVASGSDHPALPPRSAQQLLAGLLAAKPPALSGTVVETARLGLPELPATTSGSADLSLPNLITGSHTLRVWLDGPEKQRVALVGELAESDVVHNGGQVWLYSSSANEATKITVPADAGQSTESKLQSQLPTPQQAAAQAIAAITPTTKISVDDTARVAGRPVYQLVLQPKDSRSLVSAVKIAVDSETSTPLRVQVFGQDRGTPAFETGFTDVTFSAPPASVFAFIPPTGAKVTTASAGEVLTGQHPGDRLVRQYKGVVPAGGTVVPQMRTSTKRVDQRTRTIGTGWTAVLVMDGSALTPNGSGDGVSQAQSILLGAARKVSGGRLLTTALVSILLTDDGRLFVGAVDGASLQKVAATGRPL
jgi:outer membrane lipoprotein-sorting protein